MKYKGHPSILSTQSQCEARTFRLTKVNAEDIKKEIIKLNKDKASQVSDIPVKVIKDNVDIFANFIYENTSSVCKSSLSPFCLKSADMASLHKKVKMI